MTRPDEHPEPDAAEVQPTDNSTGNPVDLERVEDLPEQDADARMA